MSLLSTRLRYTKLQDVESPIRLNEQDTCIYFTIPELQKNERDEDKLDEYNDYTLGITITPPLNTLIFFLTSETLLNLGYVMEPCIITKHTNELIIKIKKIKDCNDIPLPCYNSIKGYILPNIKYDIHNDKKDIISETNKISKNIKQNNIFNDKINNFFQ